MIVLKQQRFFVNGLASAVAAVAVLLGGCQRCETPPKPRDAGTQPPIDAAPEPPRDVSIPHELMIRDVSVVEDPRASCAGPQPDQCGVWSFGHLMAAMAGSRDHRIVSRFAASWMDTWGVAQTVNQQTIGARGAMQALVAQPWIDASGGDRDALDFSKAPFRLQAIVNRMDLRTSEGDRRAGEGRFVFAVLDARGAPLQFTVILEYGLPASDDQQVRAWAERWHELGRSDVGSDAYKRVLEQITERFAGFSATADGRSPINQVRTNEIALTRPWQMREFTRACRGAACELVPATVKQSFRNSLRDVDLRTPAGSPLLTWMQDNAREIRAQTYVIPEAFSGAALLASHDDVPAISADARHFSPRNLPPDLADLRPILGRNTCAGCHFNEIDPPTPFLHIHPRQPRQPSRLSQWLDTVDLPRRKADLEALLRGGSSVGLRSVRKSAGARVH